MNKTILLLSTVISLFALNGCKKDKQTDTDISGFFNNTEWAGEIKYNNQPFAQPYLIQFTPNGKFSWHQVEGSYNGTYTTDKATKTVSLQFYAGPSIKAVVTADKKLTNFTYGASNYPYVVTGGEIVNTTALVLDNTVWSSKETTSTGNVLNKTFEFLPGSKIKYGTTILLGSYERFGASIRHTLSGPSTIFLVLTKEDKMFGTWTLATGFAPQKLELTKQ